MTAKLSKTCRKGQALTAQTFNKFLYNVRNR